LPRKIVQDQSVNRDELPDLGVVAVLGARGPQALRRHVGAAEGDATAPTPELRFEYFLLSPIRPSGDRLVMSGP
jgi:hypothetical protein